MGKEICLRNLGISKKKMLVMIKFLKVLNENDLKRVLLLGKSKRFKMVKNVIGYLRGMGNKETLVEIIKRIRVNKGITIKKVFPKGKGISSIRVKERCHIFIRNGK